MERVILHCDLNSFFASVEELYHPETRGMPVAVGGDSEKRHGIILARNQKAKQYGVLTAETIWQARKKCPELIIYPAHYHRYELFSQRTRAIFSDYTDLVEPFGIDEAWLDVTHSTIFGTGKQIADKIRERIKHELGITASVGVSFNKIFAKLGSDLRKPDYTTEITRENMRELVWPLPADQLLFAGKRTAGILKGNGINTIGQLAQADDMMLQGILGKAGFMLKSYANGLDESPVQRLDYHEPVKSIGNSTTCYRDLETDQDVSSVMWTLAESVASRLREQGFMCCGLAVSMRDNQLNVFSRQVLTDRPVNTAAEIMSYAWKLYHDNYRWHNSLRSIGIRCFRLTAVQDRQLSLFEEDNTSERDLNLEKTIDDIRKRYGSDSVIRGSVLFDPSLTSYRQG